MKEINNSINIHGWTSQGQKNRRVVKKIWRPVARGQKTNILGTKKKKCTKSLGRHGYKFLGWNHVRKRRKLKRDRAKEKHKTTNIVYISWLINSTLLCLHYSLFDGTALHRQIVRKREREREGIEHLPSRKTAIKSSSPWDTSKAINNNPDFSIPQLSSRKMFTVIIPESVHLKIKHSKSVVSSSKSEHFRALQAELRL